MLIVTLGDIIGLAVFGLVILFWLLGWLYLSLAGARRRFAAFLRRLVNKAVSRG